MSHWRERNPQGTAQPSGRELARLALVPEEPDQVLRLHHFQEEHPYVIVGGGDGFRQARIPEPNDGETVITRYTLRELLDRLDEVTKRQQDQPGPPG